MNLNLVQTEDLKKLEDKIDKILSAISKSNNQQSNETYTNKDLCRRLGVCPKTLQQYRKNGIIEFSQTGRKIHYRESQIQKFLDNHRVNQSFN